MPVDDAEVDASENTPTRIFNPGDSLPLNSRPSPSEMPQLPPPPSSQTWASSRPSVASAGQLAALTSSREAQRFQGRTEPAQWKRSHSTPPPGPSSIAPMALSEPTPQLVAKSGGTGKWIAGLAAAALVCLGGVGAFAAYKSGAFTSGGGALNATVASNNRPVEKYTLFVDGVKKCEGTPCRVEGLTRGAHFVRVEAEGYEPTADQAVAIDSNIDSAFSVQLTPKASNAASAATAEKKPAESEASSEPAREKSEAADSIPAKAAPAKQSGVARSAAKAAPAKASKGAEKPAAEEKPAADEKGIIVISSNPPSNIVVDGRPLGSTPKAVRVSPGPHTVVFVGESGRSVRSVTVAPGGKYSVAASF